VIDRLGKITGHKCQASAQAGFGFGAPEGAATDDCLFMAGPSGTIEATVESIVQSVRRPTKQKDRPKAVAVATGKGRRAFSPHGSRPKTYQRCFWSRGGAVL
jgi:hypothetical protein